MEIKSIFEKVNLIVPLEQRRFFNYLEDTANELIAKYGEKFVLSDDADVCTHNNKIEGEINILPQYEKSIVCNILFNAGAGEQYISEFLRHADAAYLFYWRNNAKGKRLKKKEW
jgi:hypothetical protein